MFEFGYFSRPQEYANSSSKHYYLHFCPIMKWKFKRNNPFISCTLPPLSPFDSVCSLLSISSQTPRGLCAKEEVIHSCLTWKWNHLSVTIKNNTRCGLTLVWANTAVNEYIGHLRPDPIISFSIMVETFHWLLLFHTKLIIISIIQL